ncbi:MAG: DUF1152 domain-containing protein [Proteobacteria bacterium]|jgi:hypothetical protein|nr:DUF1152 domain-containing protein [Pseudomonadota bacterium]
MLWPFFERLGEAKHVLVAGAGGGFDVFSGLPLAFSLRKAGKKVTFANLTFSAPCDRCEWVAMGMFRVTADSTSMNYSPERDLCEWFRRRGEEVEVFCLQKYGVQPTFRAYEVLLERLDIDAIVLVDGGTDSLMRGDEELLGTPVEDMTSISAVHLLTAPVDKYLLCLGFGVDTYHGVSQGLVLKAIAELARTDGYLGALALVPQMEETKLFMEAVEFVQARTSGRESVVCSSIMSAVEGHFGDHHRTSRTAGSQLFINPLMGLYWAFDLTKVAERIQYLPRLVASETYGDVRQAILEYRSQLAELQGWLEIPL